MMTTFLAVCLRKVWSDNRNGDVELELCTVLASQVSNWSLDLEQCPIELDFESAQRLHDTGHQIPARKKIRHVIPTINIDPVKQGC